MMLEKKEILHRKYWKLKFASGITANETEEPQEKTNKQINNLYSEQQNTRREKNERI